MNPVRSQRLDSWKEVAEFLGRSTRTAQRWHALYGLPVYSAAQNNSSVFAFVEELHAWMTRRGAIPETGTVDSPPFLGSREDLKESPAAPRLAQPALIDTPVRDAAIRESSRLAARGYTLWRVLSVNNMTKMTQLFRTAVDLDPNNAQAYAGLAHALVAQGLLGMLQIPDAYRAAGAAANLAIELDPVSDESRSALAWARLLLEHDWRGVRGIFGDLIQRPGLNGRAMVGYGMLLIAEGRAHEASEVLYEACLKEPLIPSRWGFHCWADYLSHEYEEASEHIVQGRQSGNSGRISRSVEALVSLQTDAPAASIEKIGELMEQDPGVALLRGALGHALAMNGDFDRASSHLHDLARDRSHTHQVPYYAICLILVALGEHEQALRALDQSYCAGSLWSLGFHSDPALQPLQKDPRFQAFLRRAYPLDPDSSLGVQRHPTRLDKQPS